jgi:hypothetical protein
MVTVDGGGVLPGFALPLKDLFGELDRMGPQQEGNQARARAKRLLQCPGRRKAGRGTSSIHHCRLASREGTLTVSGLIN